MSRQRTRRPAFGPDAHVIDLPSPSRGGNPSTAGRFLALLLAVGAAGGAWAVLSRPEPSALGLFLLALAALMLIGALFGDRVSSATPKRVIVDPARSAVIIERSDGRSSTLPRSSIEDVRIASTQQTWTTGDGRDRVVHTRPAYQLEMGKAGGSGFLALKLSGKVADAAKLNAPLAVLSAALEAVPSVAQGESDLVADSWLMLQHASGLRVEGPAPSSGWDPQNEPLTIHFLPDTRPGRLIQAFGLFGVGSTCLFTFLVMATSLGEAAPTWFNTATLGVLLTGGIFGILWGLRDRFKHIRFRIDGVCATHTVAVGKREVAYRRWPLELVDSVELIPNDTGDKAGLTVSSGPVVVSSEAGNRVAKFGGSASTQGAAGFVVSVGKILGNRIGSADLPIDDATRLEILLNAAIRNAREALPG